MGTFFSLSKSATSTALGMSELALLLFGLLLVVGLIGEYTKAEHWKRHVRVFEMFVIIGVAGELLADGGIFLFSGHLQTIADLEIANLTKEAGNAKESADEAASAAQRAREQSDKTTVSASNALALANGARREADSFEKDIKSAKKQAASAESHLADALQRAAAAERKIAELRTPRSLSEEQQKRIASKIKPFAETPFDLWVSTDSESAVLLESIDAALRSAEWKFNLPGNPMMYAEKAGLISASGVSIHVQEEHRGEWESAVLALANALRAEGIPAAAIRDLADSEKGKARDRIHVMVAQQAP